MVTTQPPSPVRKHDKAMHRQPLSAGAPLFRDWTWGKLLPVFLLLLHFTAHGQNIAGNVGPGGSSGGATAGTNLVNVDLYTGTGSVGIPIHSYSNDNLSFAVSLVYNAKGNRVDDISSSAGLGWSLNAGGIITREVHGIEDEVTIPVRFTHPAVYYKAWGYTPSCPNCLNLDDTLQGILAPGAIITQQAKTNPGVNYPVYDDQEYDVFNFSAGGRSFAFALKRNSSGGLSYYTYPKTECKIDVYTKDLLNGLYVNARAGIDYNMGLDSVTNLLSFVITDEHGNRFYFDPGDLQEKEFELDPETFIPSKGTYYATQSWLLDRVETCTGEVIKFYYTRKHIAYTQSVTQTLDGKEPVLTDANGQYLDSVGNNPLKIKDQVWKGYKHHISQIDFPNAVSVKFDLDYSDEDRCDCKGDFLLKNIIIESKFDNTYKNTITYRLNHAYFNTPRGNLTAVEFFYANCTTIKNQSLTTANGFTTQAEKELHMARGMRLKLNSIDRIGTDTTSTESLYSFYYNQTRLPYRFHPSQDYYGYYNGQAATPFYWWSRPSVGTGDSAFYVSIPFHSVYPALNPNDAGTESQSTWGAVRTHNFDSAQALVLTKIKSGLGGQDSIIYTDYQLSNPACSYGDFSNFPGPGNPLHCNIDAGIEGDDVNDGLVLGKIISTDKNSADIKLTREYTYKNGVRFLRGGYTWYMGREGYKVFTNYFTDPHNTIDGSNHGFDTVIATSYGYNNEQLSRTKYTFSNLMYGGESSVIKPTGARYHTFPATMKKHRMGMPLRTETYDELGNMLSLQVNFYEHITMNDSIKNRNRYTMSNAEDGPTYCWGEVGYWDNVLLDYEKLRIIGSSTTRYVKGPGVTTPKSLTTLYYYSYDSYDNVKVIGWSDSKGNTYKKKRFYNYDYKTGYPSSTFTYMEGENMQYLLGSEVWRMVGTDSVLLSYELNVPQVSGSVLRFPASFATTLKDTLPDTQVSTAINKAAALNFPSYSNYGSRFEKVKEFTRYDSRNNPVETRYNNQDIYDAGIWDTWFGNKIAEVKNARYLDIAYTSFDGIYKPAGLPDDSKGNWWFDVSQQIYTPSSPQCSTAVTGKYVYRLNQVSNTDSNYIKSKPLGNKTYLISFWTYKPNANSDLKVTRYNGTTSLGTITTTVLNTVGNWNLNVGTFTPSAGNHIMIKNLTNGTGNNIMYIDEVRLHPVEASMTTSTHKPLFGTGSTCSPDHIISHVEYDAQGRPTIVRDMRGNIISKTETVQDKTDPNTTGSSSNTPTY